MEEHAIMKRRKGYFKNLLNKTNVEEADKTEGPIGNTTEEGVMFALKGKKNNKSSQPSGLPTIC